MSQITTALHEIMQKVSYVQKTGENSFHGYRYAGEADLLAVLRPAMIEAGLLLIPTIRSVHPIDEYGNVLVIMDYTLAHKDGEVWPDKLSAAGMGNDKNRNGVGDKGLYKAITGANKYMLFKLFQIETGDDPEVPNGIEQGGHDQPAHQPMQQPMQTEHTAQGIVPHRAPPPPPSMPSNFYLPAPDDPTWEFPDVVVNNIQATLESDIPNLETLTKYWAALHQAREILERRSPEHFSALKAAFAQRNHELRE